MNDPHSKTYRFICYWFKTPLIRIIFFIWGFYTMPTKEIDIWDFWGDYEPTEQNKGVRSPIIISNHVSWMDMFILLIIGESPSFLSKMSVKKIPLVGGYAKMHQVIFMDRNNKKDRENILGIIQERAEKAVEGKFNPMIIFPEGTTTNGRAMMKFKKGGFFLPYPITVTALWWDGHFIPCLDLITAPRSALIFLSSFRNKVSYMRIKQPIDPLWILKKHGREVGEEGNWEIIAKEIKELMCFAFGIRNCDKTFRDKVEFDCKAQGITKEQLFKRE